MTSTKFATIISSLTALLLVIIKLVIWIFSWSIAVLSSAIDSLLDLFVSVFNFFAIKNSEKPQDKDFNYWRWKIEALASLFEWVVITCSWLYIYYESIYKLVVKSKIEYIWESILVMIISFFITLFLVIFLERTAKKTNNIVIKSDSLHYKTDLLTNGWILFALIIIKFYWFNFIDWLLWIWISVFIILSAYQLIKNWFLLLLDISIDKKIVKKIKEIILWEKEVNWFHFLRTRESANTKFVDFHLVFNKEIKLVDAHKISDKIEEKIINLDKNCEWIFNIHLDPEDDSNSKIEKIKNGYNNNHKKKDK